MPRRLVRYVLDVSLLAAALLTLLTGLLAGSLDLHRFGWHRWAAYALTALVLVHVALHVRFFLPRSEGHRADEADGDGPGRPDDESPPLPRERPAGGLSRRAALSVVGAGAAGAAAGWFTRSELAPDPFEGGDVGLYYHRQSSLGLASLLPNLLPQHGRPAPYEHVGRGPSIALPAVAPVPALGVGEAIARRRSLRDYRDRPMTRQELAWLVHATTGVSSADGHRVAPSAGALYPIETYVAVARVDGIARGLYHVDVRAQALEPVREGSVADELAAAALGQDFLREAPTVFVLTGLFQRTRWKYRGRHYRYVCWEGGHIAQNLYLAAEAAGLGACMVGGFFDGMLNDLLRVDGRREAALGLVAVGPR